MFCLYLLAQDQEKQPSADSVFIPSDGDDEIAKDKKKFSIVQSHNRLPVNSRHANEKDIINIKHDNAFWYADYKPKPEAEKKPRKNFLNFFLGNQWLKIILFIIFGIAIIWFIIAGDFKLFRPRSKSIMQGKINVADQDIFETAFESEISKAIADNDFQLAIRLHYLQSLKILSLKKIIQYSPDHTNQDFVHQLRNSSYYKDFFSLTRSFEYIWYGKFEVSQPAFEIIQNNFISFKKQIDI